MQTQKIEGVAETIEQGPRTVSVEGIGPMEFRNEPIEVPKVIKSAETMVLGEELEGPAIKPSMIPEPKVARELTQTPQTMPLGMELEDMDATVPEVITNFKEYALALSLAKFNGHNFIVVSDKMFYHLMKNQPAPKDRDPEIQWLVHDSVKVYKVGTREKCLAWENRVAP